MNENQLIEKQYDKRILILDDEIDIRKTLVEMFETIGYSCDGAADGSEGIELLSKNDYWLIISDIMMPEISGPEFFRKIQNKYKYDYFIFLTGYDVPKNEINTVKKADLLLCKPITIDNFLKSINKLTGTPVNRFFKNCS
jgi:CheY-like chemotaxis protein